MSFSKGNQMNRRIAKEIREEIVAKVQAGERVADLAEQYAVKYPIYEDKCLRKFRAA